MVKLETRDNIALLTLNNPDKRNMLTPDVCWQIAELVQQVEADDSIRALIVTGAGKAFCAGGRLDDLQADEAVLRSIYNGFLGIANCSIPTIAAVNGAAVGAGFNLALSCDVRIVTEQAKFIPRFFEIGLHPGGGNSWMLRQLANWDTAAGMLLFSQTLTGQQAVEKGLAWQCVPNDKLIETAFALTDTIKHLPRELLVKTKQSLRQASFEPSHATMVDVETEKQKWSLEQPFAQEAIAELKAKISKQN